MSQNAEQLSIDIIRVAHQLIIEVTWEVPHQGYGDTYHG